MMPLRVAATASGILQLHPLPVLGALHARKPRAVFEIPVDGLAHARFERFARRPAELAPKLRRVDRVAAVVPGSILDVRDEPLAVELRAPYAHEPADRVHDVDVGHLRVAADVVRLAV